MGKYYEDNGYLRFLQGERSTVSGHYSSVPPTANRMSPNSVGRREIVPTPPSMNKPETLPGIHSARANSRLSQRNSPLLRRSEGFTSSTTDVYSYSALPYITAGGSSILRTPSRQTTLPNIKQHDSKMYCNDQSSRKGAIRVLAAADEVRTTSTMGQNARSDVMDFTRPPLPGIQTESERMCKYRVDRPRSKGAIDFLAIADEISSSHIPPSLDLYFQANKRDYTKSKLPGEMKKSEKLFKNHMDRSRCDDDAVLMNTAEEILNIVKPSTPSEMGLPSDVRDYTQAPLPCIKTKNGKVYRTERVKANDEADLMETAEGILHPPTPPTNLNLPDAVRDYIDAPLPCIKTESGKIYRTERVKTNDEADLMATAEGILHPPNPPTPPPKELNLPNAVRDYVKEPLPCIKTESGKVYRTQRAKTNDEADLMVTAEEILRPSNPPILLNSPTDVSDYTQALFEIKSEKEKFLCCLEKDSLDRFSSLDGAMKEVADLPDIIGVHLVDLADQKCNPNIILSNGRPEKNTATRTNGSGNNTPEFVIAAEDYYVVPRHKRRGTSPSLDSENGVRDGKRVKEVDRKSRSSSRNNFRVKSTKNNKNMY